MTRSIKYVSILLLCFVLVGCTGGLFGGVKVDGPLRFDNLYIRYDMLDFVEAIFVVTNTSTETTRNFTVEIECWDADGNKLKKFDSGDYTYYGIAQTPIEPGVTTTIVWTLYGYDTAYKIKGTITSAIDTNDKRWDRSKNDNRYVKEARAY